MKPLAVKGLVVLACLSSPVCTGAVHLDHAGMFMAGMFMARTLMAGTLSAVASLRARLGGRPS